MNKDVFDGFSVSLLQDEEGDWLAHFAELPNVSAAGDTPEEAIHELTSTWELIKESDEQHKEPIPVAPSKKEI